MLAEDALLANATSGDDQALRALLERHGPEIRRGLSIGNKWRSVLDPEDVMQVTYVEAFLQIDRFTPQGPGSFPAWLRRIAQNNLRDAIKALEREKRQPPGKRVESPGSEDSFVALHELLGATSTTPSRVVAGEEIKGVLEAAIAKLPPNYARVIRLYDLEGKSGPEVAAAMGRSRGAVVLLRIRAHDRLRELLGSATKFFSSGT